MRAAPALAALTLPLLIASAPPASPTERGALPPSGTTKLVSRLSSKCADVEGWSTANGGNVHQWSCRLDNDDNQKWTFRRTADGYWTVVNKLSGKCLDVEGPSLADGAHLHQWECRGYSSQKWEVVNTSTTPEFFKLINAYSKKCMDVSEFSHADGAQIHQWTCRDVNNDNQQWRYFTAG